MNIEQIDTRHGTANQRSFSHGNCLPYTGVPFGMNYFAPQTNEDSSWWFHPEDRTFLGYRLTHQPSPWMGDFSRFLLTPVSGSLSEQTLFHAQSSYRPEESIFSPTHLQIRQLRYLITSTLIPSMYGGLLKINYQKNDNGLLLQLPGRYQIESSSPHLITGWLINYSGCEDPDFKLYFTMKLSEPLQEKIEQQAGEDGFIRLSFGDIQQQILQLGISFINQEQSLRNLQREMEQQPEDYLTSSQNQWQHYFERLQIEHHDLEQTKTFYHNLYRSFLFPQTFYEHDETGQPIHYDTYNKKVQTGVLYTNNGFWDTCRTVYPLFSLIAQEKYEEILEGLLNSYRETGFLPKWLSPDERGLMPGTLVDGVIADAAIKEIRLDLLPELFEGMKRAATVQSDHPHYGRQGTADYLTYGYVPSSYHESVNHTLDYAYSDFCISQSANVLQRKADADFYQEQSLNYRNVFDKETGFMRAKDQEGKFREDFSSIRWGRDYAEGSAWQSSFAVYQDFSGLIEAFGGEQAFEEKLIELCNQQPDFSVEGYGFEIHEMSEMAAVEFGQLALSNQPSFHLPYLFNYLGKPEMAQPLIKQLMTQLFDSTSYGYPGDEDNGSMSGWYIFNSLGFYPVTPGSGEYVIGMPLVDKATIQLSNGKVLKIETGPNKPQQQFIHEIKRNEQVYDKLYFQHKDLLEGGTITYHLGIVPNTRKYNQEQRPFSLSDKI